MESKGLRNIMHTVTRRIANWIGRILRRRCLLKHVMEGEVQGRIEVKERLGRRRRQLLNDLKETGGYWKLKEETLDRTVWINDLGRDCGLVRGEYDNPSRAHDFLLNTLRTWLWISLSYVTLWEVGGGGWLSQTFMGFIIIIIIFQISGFGPDLTPTHTKKSCFLDLDSVAFVVCFTTLLAPMSVRILYIRVTTDL
jgi:hypothetical protein